MGIADFLMGESLSTPFVSDQNKKLDKNISNDPNIIQTVKELGDDSLGGAMVIDGSNSTELEYTGYNSYGAEDKFMHQNRVIQAYRELVADQEVSNGVDIICNELIWTTDNDVFKITITEENEKISEVINDAFEKVLDVINVRENMFNIGRQMYVDGQLNVSLAYDKRDITKGIQRSAILEPFNLYFNKQSRTWKYKAAAAMEGLYSTEELENNIEFTEPEMVHVDYGLYTRIMKDSEMPYQINLGYLENVFKTSNMLQTLENMLVPMRYSRSVSRRLFNIDVADLPPKQAKALMDKIRAEFRYKKSYDPSTGTIKNMRNTTPIVEDYWMSNRGGSKGTTVDTMDEKGSVMDMEDIIYAAKKLYSSLKIPTSRNPYSDDQSSFSFEMQEVTQEELSFYIFVSRLRIPLSKMIKEILRRELVSTGVFMDSEWKKYEKKIEIDFTSNQIFLENMKTDMFLKNVEAFTNVKENVGETFSLQTAVENTFSWSSEQLEEELKKIETEKMNPSYKAFYERDPDGDGDAAW